MDNHSDQTTDQAPSSVFQSIVEAISRTINLPASVWVLDEQSQALRIVASVGLPSSYVREASLALSEPSVTGEAFKSGQVKIVHNVLSDPLWKYKDKAKEMGWKSALCVPIQAQGAVIGVISIYTFVVRDFSDLEKQLLKDYATQVGLALEADKGRKTLARLLDIGDEFARLIAGEPKVVLGEIAKGACEVTGADCAVIYPYDAAREEFYDIDSVASYGLRHRLELKDKPRRTGAGARIVREKELVRSNVEQEDPDMFLKSPFIVREGVVAFIGIALEVADKVLGILYVDFRTLHQFSDEEKNTIRLFAHQAAIAIDNSRLYQQAETRAEALRKLYEAVPDLMPISVAPEKLENILTRIARNAQAVLGADLIDLYQYIQSQDRYILPPVQVGERHQPLVRKDRIYEDDVVWTTVKNRQAQYIAEVQQEPDLIKPFEIVRPDIPSARFVIREDIKSTAAVPLIVGTEVIGVLFANYRSPQTFPQQQRELIELFASQAAIAIRNVRLFEQRKTLQNIAQDITSILDKDELLQNILTRSLGLLGCEIGSICLLNKTANELEFQYAIGKERYLSVPFGKGLIGTAAEERRPIRIGDVANDPRYIEHVAATRSELDVPMLIGDELVGVLNAESTRYNAFDEDSEELATILAGQAAVALYNASLFEQRQVLQEIARDITSKLDRDELLQTILEQSLLLLKCTEGSIALIDKPAGELVYQYALGKQKWARLAPGEGLMGAAAHLRKPVRVGDVTKNSHYVRHVEDTRSELDVPLLIGDDVVGVLNAESPRYNAFSEEDENLAMTLASQAAVALYNAELFERTQKQLEQRQILNEVSKLLVEEHDVDETIRLLVQKAINLFNVDQGSFWFVDYVHNCVSMRFSISQSGKTTDWQEKAQTSVPLDANSSIVSHTAVTGVPDLWNDPSKCSYWNPGFDKQTSYKTKRILSVPLLLEVEAFQEVKPIVSLESADRVKRQKAIGVLQLLNPVDDSDFTEEDKGFLMSIAAMAAVALHNAEMHEREFALSELGRELTAGIRLQEDEVLKLIHRQASKLMDTDNMYIALYDEMTDTVRFGLAFVDGKSIDVETDERWQPRKAGKGRTEEIIRTKQPIFTATKAEAEAWYAQPEHREYTGEGAWASWLGVPMMIGQRVLGMIATYHPTQDHVYSKDDQEILQAMADHAAIALDNSYMFYDVNRRLQALVEFGHAVTSGIRLREDEVLELIYRQASQLMDTSNMYIALYDEPTDTVRFGLAFVDGKRMDVETDERWQPRKAGKGRTEEIIHTKQPIFTATKADADAWYAQPERKDYWIGSGIVFPSWLGVPMMVGQKVLGVIATYHPTRDYVYSGDDLKALFLMASQAAVAIENARLYSNLEERTLELEDRTRQLQKRNEQLAALQAIGVEITSQLELKEVLGSIAEHANTIMSADFSTIFPYDSDQNRFDVGVRRGKIKIEPSTPSNTGFSAQIASSAKSVFAEIAGSSGAKPTFIENKRVRSFAGIPLVSKNKTVGILYVNYLERHSFSKEEQDVISLLTNQAAAAIENAKLYQELKSKQGEIADKERALVMTSLAMDFVHEINNLAGTIVPWLTLAKRSLSSLEGVKNTKAIQYLDNTARDAELMLQKAQEFRNPVIGPERIAVEELTGSVIGQVSMMTSPDVEIVFEAEPDLPRVYANERQLSTALYSVIHNATKAITGPGKITINLKRDPTQENCIQINISDTGYGIPADKLDNIFEYGTSNWPDGKGLGYGLWRARSILRNMNGDIRVTHSVPGEGSTFTIVLPTAHV